MQWHSRSGSRRRDPTCVRSVRGAAPLRKTINHFFSRVPAGASECVRDGNGQDAKAVVPLPDLHIKSDAFCRAQDLLIQYDDEPALVRPAELAEMVRELLTEPHWNCAADPSIVPHAHPVAQSHPATRSGQARRRRTG